MVSGVFASRAIRTGWTRYWEIYNLLTKAERQRKIVRPNDGRFLLYIDILGFAQMSRRDPRRGKFVF